MRLAEFLPSDSLQWIKEVHPEPVPACASPGRVTLCVQAQLTMKPSSCSHVSSMFAFVSVSTPSQTTLALYVKTLTHSFSQFDQASHVLLSERLSKTDGDIYVSIMRLDVTDTLPSRPPKGRNE